MAKFSDLDQERRKHLIVVLRSLEIAVASLIKAHDGCGEATRIMLLQQAESDVNSLSPRQIAELLKKLDAIADA